MSLTLIATVPYGKKHSSHLRHEWDESTFGCGPLCVAVCITRKRNAIDPSPLTLLTTHLLTPSAYFFPSTNLSGFPSNGPPGAGRQRTSCSIFLARAKSLSVMPPAE